MSSAAIAAEPGVKMEEHRLLAENESVQVAFHANATFEGRVAPMHNACLPNAVCFLT